MASMTIIFLTVLCVIVGFLSMVGNCYWRLTYCLWMVNCCYCWSLQCLPLCSSYSAMLYVWAIITNTGVINFIGLVLRLFIAFVAFFGCCSTGRIIRNSILFIFTFIVLSTISLITHVLMLPISSAPQSVVTAY